MRACHPSRSTPAAARISASYSPRSSFARRVFRLPRTSTASRSGRRAPSWARLRSELVPTRAPGGSASSVPAAPPGRSRTSRGSSRSVTAASTSPSGSRVGTSLSEWTASSARPSRSAASSSFVNRPLSPMRERGTSWMRSPVVFTTSMLASAPAAPSRSRTARACQRASSLPRETIRSVTTATAPLRPAWRSPRPGRCGVRSPRSRAPARSCRWP